MNLKSLVNTGPRIVLLKLLDLYAKSYTLILLAYCLLDISLNPTTSLLCP